MIVIDMDMPKNCTDCPCLNSEYGYCQVDYKRMDRFNATKPKNCPIKCDIEQISSARYNNGFYDGKKAMEEKIEQIRAEIKTLKIRGTDDVSITNNFAIDKVLQIIDKQMKGGK